LTNEKTAPGLSFTARTASIARVLSTKVYIESPITKSYVEANALWDTGASSSLITPEIAVKLNLKPISKTMMATPSDKRVQSNVYLINLYLPNKAKIVAIQALEGTPSSCDMLIGMDVITLGDFSVTNFNGKTTFSFRMPSMTEIDFTKSSYIEPV
jgi:predicted aspartyl protease